MYSEIYRIHTFLLDSWQYPNLSKQLLSDGFYFDPNKNQIICAFCKNTHHVTINLRSDCSHKTNCAAKNYIEEFVDDEKNKDLNNIKFDNYKFELKIKMPKNIIFSEPNLIYSTFFNRFKTFKCIGCKEYHKTLANFGFYLKKTNIVKCFSCGIEYVLREKHKLIYYHAINSERCNFLKNAHSPLFFSYAKHYFIEQNYKHYDFLSYDQYLMTIMMYYEKIMKSFADSPNIKMYLQHLYNFDFLIINRSITNKGYCTNVKFELEKLININTTSNGDSNHSCIICFERDINTAFYPCGHTAFCSFCKNKYTNNTCPICRKRIKSTIQLYKP